MNWRKIQLNQIADINSLSIGRDFKFETIRYLDISSVGTGYIYEIQDISVNNAPSRAKRLIRAGDTIISTVRPGRRSMCFFKDPDPNLVASTGFTVLTPNRTKVDARFLYYLVFQNSFTEYLVSQEQGSAYPAVTPAIVGRKEVLIPELSTQRKISSILSAYDDLIEVNLKRIKLLEEAADLIYKEWFVNFRFPGYENMKFVGGIPEGWVKTTLSEVANIVMGQSPESKYYNTNKEGLPFHQGVATFRNRYVFHRNYSTVGSKIAEEGDILFSVRAPVGRINLTDRKIIIGRGLCSIRHRKNYQSFLFHQLKNIFFKEDIIGSGAIYNAVKKDELGSFELPKPEDAIIHLYEDLLSPVEFQIKNLTMQIELLIEARDLLLPKLMSGEIEV